MKIKEIKNFEEVWPDTKTSHLDPCFFEEKNKWLKTYREQRAFGEGYNQSKDVCSEVQITCDVEELARNIYEADRASFKHNKIAELDPYEEIEEALKNDFRFRARFLSTQLSKYIRLGKG